MKRILLTGCLAGMALAVTATVQIPTADAQVSSGRNPWCLRDGPLGRGTWDCTYHNYKQCYDSSVYGSDGSCERNPNYRGAQNRDSRPQQQPQGTWGWGGGRY
ncbi:MAG TPA: DUF3551 domain-containing protein [Xanthobacteraceae bacterium]|nr:DUF3551 domain-containing protein [Xanthobacteraceae bacterium]